MRITSILGERGENQGVAREVEGGRAEWVYVQAGSEWDAERIWRG